MAQQPNVSMPPCGEDNLNPVLSGCTSPEGGASLNVFIWCTSFEVRYHNQSFRVQSDFGAREDDSHHETQFEKTLVLQWLARLCLGLKIHR